MRASFACASFSAAAAFATFPLLCSTAARNSVGSSSSSTWPASTCALKSACSFFTVPDTCVPTLTSTTGFSVPFAVTFCTIPPRAASSNWSRSSSVFSFDACHARQPAKPPPPSQGEHRDGDAQGLPLHRCLSRYGRTRAARVVEQRGVERADRLRERDLRDVPAIARLDALRARLRECGLRVEQIRDGARARTVATERQFPGFGGARHEVGGGGERFALRAHRLVRLPYLEAHVVAQPVAGRGLRSTCSRAARMRYVGW